MKKVAFVLGAAAILAMAQAQAQTQVGKQVTDSNGDGKYSLAELRSAFPDVTEAAFAEADIDGSGFLSPEELKVNQVSGDLPS